jgi:hypothetical protein
MLQRNPKYKAAVVVKKYLHTEGSRLPEEITPNYMAVLKILSCRISGCLSVLLCYKFILIQKFQKLTSENKIL